MFRKFSFFFYKFLKIVDLVFFKILNRSFISWFKEFIEDDSYKTIKINEKNIIFFIPNNLVDYRIDTFYSKEPETLEWIDSFDKNKEIIFWDIGSNIGLYSIYAALNIDNIKVISFEPSTSNLRVLSRNISINNLNDKIFINQFPLTKDEKGFNLMMESNFIEGSALHSYGIKKDFEGNKFLAKNHYNLYGFSINYLVNKLNLEIPNYIKIDIDGLEHHILEGGNEILKNPNIKSILIEINENYEDQFKKVFSLMKSNNFKFIKKKQSDLIHISTKFKNSYNYIFSRI